MDSLARLKILSSDMSFEPAEEVGFSRGAHPPCTGPVRRINTEDLIVSNAVMPNGRRIRMLKTLLSSACERNCNYCAFRAGREYRRFKLSPDELADAFSRLYRAGLVDGLFLSSGVAGGSIQVQDQLITAAELLRDRYGFQGYLHLKLMPGAERDQVLRAMQLADRISVNLEAPNPSRLSQLAPKKDFSEELLQPLKWADEIRRSFPSHQGWKGRWPSSTTQFVVGAVAETDLELLQTTDYLLGQLKLQRAYFSGFQPVPNTPLENLAAVNPRRQDRLYQASFLLKDYPFKLEDLPFRSDGSLPLEVDPKTAWAQQNLVGQPVEINQASREELLRIPGIGPKGAQSIITARRHGRVTSIDGLHRIGINLSRSLPYILVNGKQPVQQLRFW